jgi:hypothetical protein
VNKKLVFLAMLLLLAVARVFPVVGSVNNSAGNHAVAAPALVADGDPKPAPIPHRIVIADGDPKPAPIPHSKVLVADGDPKPAPIPHRSVLIADGDPKPAPIPHGHELMIASA